MSGRCGYLPNEDVFVTVSSNSIGNDPDVVFEGIEALPIGKPFATQIQLDTTKLNNHLLGRWLFNDPMALPKILSNSWGAPYHKSVDRLSNLEIRLSVLG